MWKSGRVKGTKVNMGRVVKVSGKRTEGNMETKIGGRMPSRIEVGASKVVRRKDKEAEEVKREIVVTIRASVETEARNEFLFITAAEISNFSSSNELLVEQH
jgi:hypothetical protein